MGENHGSIFRQLRNNENVPEKLLKTVVKAMQDDYGNPSSKHMKGVDAEQYIKQAAATIARSLKCTGKRIGFLRQAERNPTIWQLSEQLWQTSAAGITLSYQAWNILPSKSRLTFWRSRAFA